MKEEPNYGTWIRKKKMYAFGIIDLIFIGLAFCGLIHPLFLIAVIPALIFLYITFIVSLTYFQFSAKGGDYQTKVHALIVERVTVKKKLLDIGCGNGHLTIKLAKRHPDRLAVGLDYWGREWEYGEATCKTNARLENASNIDFIQGSASKLPFEDESFDCVVSCLTFHEVQNVLEKEDCMREALRVLAQNGNFVFLDLFDDPKYYPISKKYQEAITTHGGMIVEDIAVHELLALPFPLNSKKSLRYARIVSGRKAG
jgi:ubiquinone/menaquinone biosynthesis C-methylase UbiE